MISASFSAEDRLYLFPKDESSASKENPYDEIEKYLAEAKEEILSSLSSDFSEADSKSSSSVIPNLKYSTEARSVSDLENSQVFYPSENQRILNSNNGSRCHHRRKQANIWSQNIFEDFQFVVNEEIKTLLDRPKYDRDLPSVKDESLTKPNAVHDNGVKSSTTNFDFKMGGNQSSFRDASQWTDAHFKTYTLPRSNQRSISLLGEKLLTSHPDFQDDPCRLIRVSQNRLSRSHSFDEGQYLNSLTLQHLQLIHEANRMKERFRHSSQVAAPPESVYGKIRKSGVSHFQNDKWENSFEEKYPRSEFEDDQNLKSIDEEFEHSTPKMNSRKPVYDSPDVAVPLTPDSIKNQNDEAWRWMDEDDANPMTERPAHRPEIVITSHHSSTREEPSDKLPERATETLNVVSPSIVEMARRLERKSEPAYPHATPPSPSIGIPGLEVRRHTLPISSCDHLDVSDTPVFSTLSWQTLPPDEEMEIMEVKPIQTSESPVVSHFGSDKGSVTVRSVNSSLSSLSQLSLRDDFSESEVNIDDFSSNLSEEPRDCQFTSHSQVYYQQYPTRSLPDDLSAPHENGDVFVDTTPVLIQLSSTEDVKSNGDHCAKKSRTKFDRRSNGVTQELANSIIGVLQVDTQSDSNDTAYILSVTIPNDDENPKMTRLNKKKQKTIKVNENNCKKSEITSLRNEDYQNNQNLISVDEPDQLSSSPQDLRIDDHRQQPSRNQEEAEKITEIDLHEFLREVETRIPSRGATCPSFPSIEACRGVATSAVKDHKNSSSSKVFDASTQTSVSPVCGSPTSSFTWLSDYDRASLEPCTSSMGLSCIDGDEESDEVDEDYWWVAEESSSSSPVPTSTSPVRDDSSLSLSESLDLLDQNVESGIGTVSTRTSTSPRQVVVGPMDLSGSNLSSEDTGLETSFELRVKRYLPNARLIKRTDHSCLYYKRRKPRLRPSDHWIKCEHQTTQTDCADAFTSRCGPPSSKEGRRSTRASSEGAPSLRHSSTDHLGRLTTSEPRLTHSVSPYMKMSNSEMVISRSLCSPPLLPTLSEGRSLDKDQSSRRHYLSSEQVLDMQSKAKSAPLLRRKMSAPQNLYSTEINGTKIQYRTQSTKEMSELEALEACKWLRAAGFPQYAQMYEDFQFPLDLLSVERDHTFLDVDSLQALFRRLRILNRCAKIRLDSSKKSNVDDSEDEDEECALSGMWQFQRHSRRWSRIDPTQIHLPGAKAPVELQACGPVRVREMSEGSEDLNMFKRSGSERIKERAKALLRRMDSLKNKKKKLHRDGIVIGSPKVLDEVMMQARMAEMVCVDISPEASPEVRLRRTSQFRDSRQASNTTEDSSSLASDQSQSSTPRFRSRRKKKLWRRGTSGEELHGAYSDSECSPHTWRLGFNPDVSSNKLETLFRDPSSSASCRISDSSDKPRRPYLRHATSLTYGRDSQKIRDALISNRRGGSTTPEATTPGSKDDRLSIYDNVPLIICNKNYQEFLNSDADMVTQEGSGSSECTMESRDSPVPNNEEDERPVIRRTAVDRWHSFNRKSVTSFKQLGTQFNTFSVGQMNHLRKRALLKLTALMERHCPSNRTAWNWELPKFMRKMKTPDYKDRVIFGVPLQVINQRMGHPLPPGIQQALAYLKLNCLGQVGIFRKPGVRSRIQKLRELHEANDVVEYSTFGPCDIADLVKTYFRELPEVLLTNKLSEIFITICQYLPMDVRLEALQCVMLMMPDENREALMALLAFLSDVAANAHLNQMTASNLAVCMAPSLFHLHVGGSGTSPLRRKNTGTPEQKDLHDNKAANQCLCLMIQQMSNLQCVPAEMLSNCRFSYLDLSQPVSLEDLGSATNLSLGLITGEGDWSSYMAACITSLLKETRDKHRGWIHVSHPDELIEVGYRKVGDGHPLRLWRVTTEVEAPPAELLARVLRERHLWDDTLLKWRVVSRLGRQAEIFQYMCNAMPPRAPVDLCVLRCWRNELGRGVCVVVETSVEHTDAPILSGATRGIVLASRYLIQPCGSGKSKITHISRIDLRGRLPEWYNKNYAHVTASHIIKLRQSFRHFSDGPESKV